jgi:hypothetical protein
MSISRRLPHVVAAIILFAQTAASAQSLEVKRYNPSQMG